jgi:hypothetical protein
MTLHEINNYEQFEEYYKSNNLITTHDKINRLKETMNLRAMLGDNESPDEILKGLEESVLQGYWKAIKGDK